MQLSPLPTNVQITWDVYRLREVNPVAEQWACLMNAISRLERVHEYMQSLPHGSDIEEYEHQLQFAVELFWARVYELRERTVALGLSLGMRKSWEGDLKSRDEDKRAAALNVLGAVHLPLREPIERLIGLVQPVVDKRNAHTHEFTVTLVVQGEAFNHSFAELLYDEHGKRSHCSHTNERLLDATKVFLNALCQQLADMRQASLDILSASQCLIGEI